MGATVSRDNLTSENDVSRSYSSNNQTGHLRALTSRSPYEHDQSTEPFPVGDVDSSTQYPTRMYTLQARMSAINDKSFKTLKEDHNSEHIAKPEEEEDRDDIRTRSSRSLETPDNDDNNDDDDNDDDDVGNESNQDHLPVVPLRATSSAISRLSRKVDVIVAASKSGINSVRGYRPVNALTSPLDTEDISSLQSPIDDPLHDLADVQTMSANVPPVSDPNELRQQQSVNRGKFRWTAKSTSLPEGKAQSSKYNRISFFDQ